MHSSGFLFIFKYMAVLLSPRYKDRLTEKTNRDELGPDMTLSNQQTNRDPSLLIISRLHTTFRQAKQDVA